MPEPPRPHDEPAIAGARRGIRWDALAAIVASLVGLLALVVGGYTAYIQREQVRAEVWPYMIGGTSSHISSFIWTNKGVGPAIVRTLEVTVAGRPQRDWQSVLKSLDVPTLSYAQSTLNGNVLSPGETISWIKFHDSAGYQTFVGAANRLNMHAVACYCSTLGDCWVTVFNRFGRTSVDQCPAVPKPRQFQD